MQHLNSREDIIHNDDQEQEEIDIIVLESPPKTKTQTLHKDEVFVFEEDPNSNQIKSKCEVNEEEEKNLDGQPYDTQHIDQIQTQIKSEQPNFNRLSSIKREEQNKRYNMTFFKKLSTHRQGISTITGKERQPVHPISPMRLDHNASYISENGKFQDKEDDTNFVNHELQNIEKNQRYKVQTEKFILLFSRDANQAFQYLFDNGIINDDNTEIARILLVTEGLNKDALNKFFCSHKKKNQQIYSEFCMLIDFKGLGFDEALRLLLSRFRMSGEAQQVDRMVKIFAEAYHQDNPQTFDSSDTAYVLAYSLIMLSTDAASTKIQQKDKMTKQQFVQNNLPIFKTLSESFFEKIYDKISKEPFDTTINYVEQMYNRMQLCNEKLQGATMKEALKLAFVLMKGSNVIKYGRQGEPQARKLFLSEDERRICWKAIDRQEPARYVNVSDIFDLALGSNTTDIMKKHNVAIEFDQFCFSAITHYRSLDVKFNDIEIKSKWVNYLRAIIIHRRENACKNASKNLKRQENELMRDEIWRVDIFPRWEFHWDYNKNRPQNFKMYHIVQKEEQIQKQQQKANQGPSILESFCSCLKNTIPLNSIVKRSSAYQNQILEQMQGGINGEVQSVSQESNIYQQGQPDIPFQGRNQSLLLMVLWKLGIPNWARQTLWPISIGNRLEFTEALFKILLNVADQARYSSQNIWAVQMFQKIEQDLRQLSSYFNFLATDQQKYESACRVLKAFVFYRPDFGYIKGMGYLACILVFHLNEFDAMKSFINMVHSYHFLPLFKGDKREIEWRIHFFDENFSRNLPLVYNHFRGLDVSSEHFLMQWFITLFCPNLPITMLSRLWDNFLLEGEVYMFKAALAYIKYYQLELKMSTFNEAMDILLKNRPDLHEDYFFIMIDEIPIKEDEYKQFIDQQKKALLNTQIHTSLLNQ